MGFSAPQPLTLSLPSSRPRASNFSLPLFSNWEELSPDDFKDSKTHNIFAATIESNSDCASYRMSALLSQSTIIKGVRLDRTSELAIVRRAYAKQILATVQVDDPHLETAFAQVPRENFVGPGLGSFRDGLVVTYRRRQPIPSTFTLTTSCRSYLSGTSITSTVRSRQMDRKRDN